MCCFLCMFTLPPTHPYLVNDQQPVARVQDTQRSRLLQRAWLRPTSPPPLSFLLLLLLLFLRLSVQRLLVAPRHKDGGGGGGGEGGESGGGGVPFVCVGVGWVGGWVG